MVAAFSGDLDPLGHLTGPQQDGSSLAFVAADDVHAPVHAKYEV